MVTRAAISLFLAAIATTGILISPAAVSVEPAVSSDPAYSDGRRDRLAWEDWFNALAVGSYRDGASWWVSERGKAEPRGCASISGDTEWEAGCRAAQQRLAIVDIRRKTEPTYRSGWDSEVAADVPPEPITISPAERAASSSPAYVDGQRDRQAWEDWLDSLPAGSYRAGAFWWWDERHKKRPAACVSPIGESQWEAGCKAAQRRLAESDIRQNTEVDYRSGWYSGTGQPGPR